MKHCFSNKHLLLAGVSQERIGNLHGATVAGELGCVELLSALLMQALVEPPNECRPAESFRQFWKAEVVLYKRGMWCCMHGAALVVSQYFVNDFVCGVA